MYNVAIDLETFSTREDAVVVAIAAVPFDETGPTGVPFYVTVDPRTQPERHIDAATVDWWLQQSESARTALTVERYSADGAAWMFNRSFQSPEDTLYWGYGAAFDNVILRSFLRSRGYNNQLTYRNDRCLRTLSAMFPDIPFVDAVNKHNARSDAVAQAEHGAKLLRRLKGA